MPESGIKELVHLYGTEKPDGETAFITSEYLVVENKENKTKYSLPEEEFFVSIAPYTINTHPWTNHNLTGCQGELANKEFKVVITNDLGEEILKETLTSHDNGFIDLWLPRDTEYEVSIEHNGKSAKSKLRTYKNSNTCITTMKLK